MRNMLGQIQWMNIAALAFAVSSLVAMFIGSPTAMTLATLSVSCGVLGLNRK